MLEKSSDVCQLGTEEERVLTSFTRRLIEIAAVAGALGCTSAIDALNSMRLPAVTLGPRGWETARNRLKSVFAKTCTHRQSELVALLLQVE